MFGVHLLSYQPMEIKIMYRLLIISANLHGYFQSQTNLMSCQIFCSFQKLVERQFNCKIKSVQTDWGREYRTLHTYFANIVIQHRITCPHTSQQNGFVERKHRHIVEMGLWLLSHSWVPHTYWDDAFLIATYLINCLPTTPFGISPFEKLYKHALDFSSLKIFGCACFPFNLHKLDLHCIFTNFPKHRVVCNT